MAFPFMLMRLALPRPGRTGYDFNDPREHIDGFENRQWEKSTKILYSWIDSGYEPWKTRRVPVIPLEALRKEKPRGMSYFAVLCCEDEYLLGLYVSEEDMPSLGSKTPPGMRWILPEYQDGGRLNMVSMSLLETANAARFGPLEAEWLDQTNPYIPPAAIELLQQGAYPSDVLIWMKNEERLSDLRDRMHRRIEERLTMGIVMGLYAEWQKAFGPEARYALYANAKEIARLAHEAKKKVQGAGDFDFITAGADLREREMRGYWRKFCRDAVHDLPGDCKIMVAVDARALQPGEQPLPPTAHIVPTKDIIKKQFTYPAGLPLGEVGPDRTLQPDDGKVPMSIDEIRIAWKIFASRPRMKRYLNLSQEERATL